MPVLSHGSHCQDCNVLTLLARNPYDSRPSDSDPRATIKEAPLAGSLSRMLMLKCHHGCPWGIAGSAPSLRHDNPGKRVQAKADTRRRKHRRLHVKVQRDHDLADDAGLMIEASQNTRWPGQLGTGRAPRQATQASTSLGEPRIAKAPAYSQSVMEH